ncbi:MAG TPA: hypothetical protein VGS01_02200 [Candidatus Limnocylindria bacterium]|nr:hypothetical protein [Candidatus Limnocylindria bacterium]
MSSSARRERRCGPTSHTVRGRSSITRACSRICTDDSGKDALVINWANARAGHWADDVARERELIPRVRV